MQLISTTALVAVLAACGGEGASTGGDPSSTESRPAAGGPFDGAQLTEALGCGFGFAQSDPAQQVLVSVHHTGESGKVRRTVSFPDPAWDAEVRVGADLAANWCTDVIEEPEAEVEETWRIVEGTLRFAGPVPPTDWEGDLPDERVRAALTGVVVEGPDGERVELDDLSLRNDAWGLVPG